jgi:hypothetical protein
MPCLPSWPIVPCPLHQKLAIEQWAAEDVYLGEHEPLQVQHFYRAMDFLARTRRCDPERGVLVHGKPAEPNR